MFCTFIGFNSLIEYQSQPRVPVLDIADEVSTFYIEYYATTTIMSQSINIVNNDSFRQKNYFALTLILCDQVQYNGGTTE